MGAALGKFDLKKLSEAGIATVAGVLMMTTKSLCEIKGMSDAKVRGLISQRVILAIGTYR